MNHATINRQRRDLEDTLALRKANVKSLMDMYLDAIAARDHKETARLSDRVTVAQHKRYQARHALAEFNKVNP